jgi:hypothetical protein
MVFRQLYYTSCEHGLLGYGGFQFNAATPGVAPGVLREVEDLTAYEPPRWMPADPDPSQLAGYPVALSHSLGSDGSRIVARVVFAGADYTGRPGNYFAHALVADSAADFGTVLPAEFWQAPVWRTDPQSQTELPPLPGPLPSGPVGRPRVQELLGGAGLEILPGLVSAVGQAMAGDRPVLLAGPDSATNAAWIAGVSYLLGPMARQLSFTTYSHRPAYSRHHLIGVVTGTEPLPEDQGFYVCDTQDGRVPAEPAHPLAVLLGRAGLVPAGALWEQATALAAGTEGGLDDWYPVVAAAVVLRGGRLDPNRDVPAAAGWLAGATHRPPDLGRVLQALLDGYGDALSTAELTGLHPLAGQLGPGLLDGLERRLADQAITRLQQGAPAEAVVQLASPRVRAQAASRCLSALYEVPPEQAPGILRWAADSAVQIPAADLRGYGSELPYKASGQVLAEILRGQPEVTAGLLTRMESSAAIAAEVFTDRDLFGHEDVITRQDLGGRPELVRQWILGARERGQLSALAALADLRTLPPGAISVQVLSRLWPDGCPAGDLRQILGTVSALGHNGWLAEQVTAALAADGDEHGEALAADLKRYPDVSGRLPPRVLASANSLAAVTATLKGARAEVLRGDTKVISELYAMYPRADKKAKNVLVSNVAKLLLDAERLGRALHGCPVPIRQAFCEQLRPHLAPFNADPVLGARVFRAMVVLEGRGELDAADDLMAEFEQVLKWPGGKRRTLRKEMPPDDAEKFELWCENHRGGTMVKIRGLLRARRDGD